MRIFVSPSAYSNAYQPPGSFCGRYAGCALRVISLVSVLAYITDPLSKCNSTLLFIMMVPLLYLPAGTTTQPPAWLLHAAIPLLIASVLNWLVSFLAP